MLCVTLQSTVLLKVRTSLVLLICKVSDLWEHVQNQDGQKTLGMMHWTWICSCFFIFSILLSTKNSIQMYSSITVKVALLVGNSITCFPTNITEKLRLIPSRESIEKIPNHFSACRSSTKDMMGFILQSTMLQKVRTSLIFLTCMVSDLWDHVQN